MTTATASIKSVTIRGVTIPVMPDAPLPVGPPFWSGGWPLVEWYAWHQRLLASPDDMVMLADAMFSAWIYSVRDKALQWIER